MLAIMLVVEKKELEEKKEQVKKKTLAIHLRLHPLA